MPIRIPTPANGSHATKHYNKANVGVLDLHQGRSVRRNVVFGAARLAQSREMNLDDAIAKISALIKRGYQLRLYSSEGECWAELQRWVYRRRIRLELTRIQFEEAREAFLAPRAA
jgi:hypothetical protein